MQISQLHQLFDIVMELRLRKYSYEEIAEKMNTNVSDLLALSEFGGLLQAEKENGGWHPDAEERR